MENIFNFSDEAVEQYNKKINLLSYVMPAAMIIFSAIIFKAKDIGNMKIYVATIACVTIFILVEMRIVKKIMIKKMRNTNLSIHENHFNRKGGKNIEKVDFDQIKSIKEKRDLKGKLLFIEIKTRKKPINIFGFENIEEILEILKSRSSEDVILKFKRYKVDWNSPLATIGVMISTVIVLGAMIIVDKNIYELFNALLGVGFALFFMFYKPVSKSLGSRFRKFEIITGSLIIVGSAMSLIGRII